MPVQVGSAGQVVWLLKVEASITHKIREFASVLFRRCNRGELVFLRRETNSMENACQNLFK